MLENIGNNPLNSVVASYIIKLCLKFL